MGKPLRLWKLRGGIWTDFLIVVPFLALFYVQLAHHELWIDEINAYAIAAASPTLRQLFAYLHYEAHPAVWYLMLWPLARWTANPVAMKWLEAGIGTAIYLFIALRSPFSRTVKVLLYLSYFISFEYTVLSRMYGVLLLEALVYAEFRARRPDRVVRNAAVLVLMANTDMMGILLTFAFAAEYLLEWMRSGTRAAAGEAKARWTAALVYFAGTVAAILTLKPARDISHLNTEYMFEWAGSMRHLGRAALDYFVLPWFPISSGFPRQFWNPDPTDHTLLYAAAFPLVIALLYMTFRRERTLGAAVFLTAIIGTTFAHLIYVGHERHYGILFIAFLMALWIQQRNRPGISAAAVILLVLSAVGGVEAAVGQWAGPFSSLGPTANYIRQHHLEDEALIVEYNPGVPELLQRPAYFLECNCIDTFMLFSKRRDYVLEDSDIAPRVQLAMRRMGQRRALLVMLYPLNGQELGQMRSLGIEAVGLSALTRSQFHPEGTFLYQVTEASQAGDRGKGYSVWNRAGETAPAAHFER